MSDQVLIYGMNYAPEVAGVGRYTGEIAEHLASTGAEVVVVTTPAHYPGWRMQSNNRYTVAVLNDVVVYRCPLILREKMGGIWRLIAPLSFALSSAPVALWQILRRRPRVILSIEPTLFGAPTVLLAAWVIGARTVLHVHDLEVDAAFAMGHLGNWTWLKRLGSLFERAVLFRFDQIITISDRMAEKIVQKGIRAERVSVVRNWVDLDIIRPIETDSPYRAELGYTSNDFIVLYAGNLGRKQGLHVLLDAARQLGDQREIRFVVAGEGPAKAELVARYGQLQNVRFLEFQPYERLSDFLALADLHALPQEANAADLVLPSKLGGMLASSKPIIAMTEPGTELVHFLRNTAILVPPGDAEALADAVLKAFYERKPDVDKARRRRELARHLSKREGLAKFVEAAING